MNKCNILRLHYRSGPNRAEPNRAGPAVQTMFGPAHFSSVLWLFTLSYKLCWPTKMCQCKRSINLLVILGCHFNIVLSLSLVKRRDRGKNGIDSSQQETDSRRRRVGTERLIGKVSSSVSSSCRFHYLFISDEKIQN